MDAVKTQSTGLLGLLFLVPAFVLFACGAPTQSPGVSSAADRFLAQLAELEGQAFEGRILVNEPAGLDDPFVGQRLVAHVRRVHTDRIEVPFHVGEDRSRTWLIARTETGLRLKHDHRHRDGSEDELTQYGGDTATPGTARRQEFPADTHSVELFERTGRQVSIPNVWAFELEPGRRLVYELARPGRLFRVEFDLTQPVPAPPTPWGH